MRKIFFLLASVALIVSCNKEDKTASEAPDLSPDGKQWFLEVNGSPEANGGLVDLSFGNGKAVIFVGPDINTIKAYNDFYCYLPDMVFSYSLKKSSDDNTYTFLSDYGIGCLFTPLSEDTGIVSTTIDKQKGNIICRTLPTYLNKSLSAVDYSSYSWVLLNWRVDDNTSVVSQIAVEDVASSGFDKLTGKYEIVVLTGDGAEEDYADKDVKGKIVFVPDGEALSFFKKRDIAFSKQAAAIILYHPTDPDGVMISNKKTFDSIPKYLGIPCGVLFETYCGVQEQMSSGFEFKFSIDK